MMGERPGGPRGIAQSRGVKIVITVFSVAAAIALVFLWFQGDSSEHTTAPKPQVPVRLDQASVAQAQPLQKMKILEKLAQEKRTEDVATYLADGDEQVRVKAVRELSKIGDAKARGHLKQATQDQSAKVSTYARTCLEEMGNR